jgi:hypothetical protein
MLETNLFSVLSAATLITAITGPNIFPVKLPDDPPLPALTYKIVGGAAKGTFTTGGITRARVQIDCWSTQYLQAVTLRAAVIAALNGYVDANLNIQFIQPVDLFDYELLQFQAVAEFYVSYAQ